MPKNKTFVLNDESEINSYGFRTSNEGLDLSRFKDNPVMLNSHNSNNTHVVGRWINIRKEGTQLLADAEFDEEDEEAMKLKGKVDRGFIKGASMGLTFNHKYMEVQPDGTYLLGKSQIMEGSIVSIPSNRKSLKLYAESGELLDQEEVKLSINQISKIQKPNMSKVTLSVAALSALGLQNSEDSAALSAAIERLHGEKNSLVSKLAAETKLREDLESKIQKETDARALSMVDGAIKEGKITADKKEKFLKLAKSDFTLASEMLAEIPAKKSLKGQVEKTGGEESKLPKDMDEFEKLSADEKASFKAENPEAYQKLFV